MSEFTIKFLNDHKEKNNSYKAELHGSIYLEAYSDSQETAVIELKIKVLDLVHELLRIDFK